MSPPRAEMSCLTVGPPQGKQITLCPRTLFRRTHRDAWVDDPIIGRPFVLLGGISWWKFQNKDVFPKRRTDPCCPPGKPENLAPSKLLLCFLPSPTSENRKKPNPTHWEKGLSDVCLHARFAEGRR